MSGYKRRRPHGRRPLFFFAAQRPQSPASWPVPAGGTRRSRPGPELDASPRGGPGRSCAIDTQFAVAHRRVKERAVVRLRGVGVSLAAKEAAGHAHSCDRDRAGALEARSASSTGAGAARGPIARPADARISSAAGACRRGLETLPEVHGHRRAGLCRSFEDVLAYRESRHLGRNECREPTRCG